jgi:predicted RNA-binding protein with PIN domain
LPLHIIIDGYNLIRQSPDLGRIDRRDLQTGREALLDLLAGYKKIKAHKITVVFDGIRAPGFTPDRDRYKGIAVIFSRRGETADRVIKKMASREREGALVVSSDRDVATFAQSRGAAIIDSSAFEQKLLLAGYLEAKDRDAEPDAGWKPTTRKKGPHRRLSKKARRSRAKIRKL